MSNTRPSSDFLIGWDVGGWNCDRNAKSRDDIVILNSELTIVGKPWRGNLRDAINVSTNAQAFIGKLFSLCDADLPNKVVHVTLAIDTPLGFSSAFTELVTGLKYAQPVERSDTNPYLYRQTERFLFEQCKLSPLSAVKDMIGSQATKGMHVLSKFAPTIARCGVWRGGEILSAIEAYPAACKSSESIATLRRHIDHSLGNKDEQDALTCALVAYLFATQPEKLEAPPDSVSMREGWIWVPKDIIAGRQL